jgi:hypothetical protein
MMVWIPTCKLRVVLCVVVCGKGVGSVKQTWVCGSFCFYVKGTGGSRVYLVDRGHKGDESHDHEVDGVQDEVSNNEGAVEVGIGGACRTPTAAHVIVGSTQAALGP